MEKESAFDDEECSVAQNLCKPKIYSKKAVFYFSFICSPVFGGAFILINLTSIGKKSTGLSVLFFSIAYCYLIGFINRNLVALIATHSRFIFKIQLGYFLTGQLFGLLFNLLAAFILSDYVQDKYIPNENEFEIRKIWIPLLIAISILLLMFVFFSFTHSFYTHIK